MAHSVFLIGGHGKVAQLAIPLLVEAGDEVTAVIRKADQAPDVERLGATALILSIEDATKEELADAMVQAGADTVVFSAGAGGGDRGRTRAVDRDAAIRSMEAAQSVGIGRYIMVSYLGASLDHGVPPEDDFFEYAQAKAEADEHLRKSRLDWTILGPAALTMAEPTGLIRIVDAESAGESPKTSRGNVARAIVAAVDEPSTIRKQLEFVDGDTPVAKAFRAA